MSPNFITTSLLGTIRAKETGEQLAETWEKMSKSKLNGVEPAEVVARHGLELTRLTMLASVGPHGARQWNEGESESFLMPPIGQAVHHKGP